MMDITLHRWLLVSFLLVLYLPWNKADSNVDVAMHNNNTNNYKNDTVVSSLLQTSSSSSSYETNNPLVDQDSIRFHEPHSTVSSNLASSSKVNQHLLLWYQDLLNLPSNEAFPGTKWLLRLTDTSIHKGSSASTFNTVGSENYSNPTNSYGTYEVENQSWFYNKHDGRKYSSIYEAIVLGDTHELPVNEPSSPETTTADASSSHAAKINPCRNFNAYVNSILIPNSVAISITETFAGGNVKWGHYLLCYIRNLFGGIIIYYGTALLFHYGCYIHSMGRSVFEKNNRPLPSTSVMLDQILLAQQSLFFYVMLPVVDEYLIENNYTRMYYTIDEIGGYGWYFFYTLLYFSLVEIGIYWMHRTLHTNKWLYKHVHMKHHKYNKPELLTPWGSIAFHPLDGIMQASPYVFVSFLVPCHYITHTIMLFFTAIWATYIHDAMDFNIDPIMGSKYHTVHHTHYVYNYGQVFIFCDWFWGTLYVPTGPTGCNNNKSISTRAFTKATNQKISMTDSQSIHALESKTTKKHKQQKSKEL